MGLLADVEVVGEERVAIDSAVSLLELRIVLGRGFGGEIHH